jgi:hypothetical protein
VRRSRSFNLLDFAGSDFDCFFFVAAALDLRVFEFLEAIFVLLVLLLQHDEGSLNALD